MTPLEEQIKILERDYLVAIEKWEKIKQEREEEVKEALENIEGLVTALAVLDSQKRKLGVQDDTTSDR